MPSRPRQRWYSVAITGAGTGLGRELALGLAAKGCIVFGTATSAAEVQDLRKASSGRVSLAVGDVTRFTKGTVWAEGVSEALDGAGLDLLINNARAVPAGPIEAITLDMARHALEENVLGAMSIINAFLPALRLSKGRIVQIIDAMAGGPVSFQGLAATSGSALEALLSAYRAELKPFGVDVTVALVGRIRDGGGSTTAETLTSAAKNMRVAQRKLYGRRLAAYAKRVDEPQTSQLNAPEAAARLIQIAELDPAPSRIAVGPDAEAVL